jgi:transcriptional regulator with XRE-family HTH domain
MNVNKLDRKRLIYCREKLGITKQEAAKRMQMSQPAYLRYESGERTPSIHVIQVMANILGTSVAYLTGQTDNPNPDSYVIKSDTEPDLFHIIDKYKNSDIEMRKRLLSYFQKYTEEK